MQSQQHPLSPALAPATTSKSRPWIIAAAWLAAIVAASLLDHQLWKWLKVADAAARSAIERRDWYQALRQLGYYPVWIAVGLILILLDRARHVIVWPRRGLLLILSSGLAGLLAELLKLAIRRQRPGDLGLYAFDWPMAAVKPPLGTVSSHAAVAFGAAFLLARLFPASRYILLPAATGTALTRLLSGAHFTSDTVAAAAIAYALAELLDHKFGPTHHQPNALTPHASST